MKNKVFAFGDNIPPGNNDELFVAFTVDDIPGGMLSGPFNDRTQADEEAIDIKTYEHVYDVKVVRRSDIQK